jgi:vacuolar-type H+-ATPase subunit I/STV1
VSPPAIRRVVLIGLAYFVIGEAFSALAGSVTGPMRIAFRLTAWLMSAVIFASHVRYEYARLDNSPSTTAWRAATAVAFGAFGVALVAYIRSRLASPDHHTSMVLTIVAWPVLAGIPAFLVALVATVVAGMVVQRFNN